MWFLRTAAAAVAVSALLGAAPAAMAGPCMSRRPQIIPSPKNPRVPIPDPPRRTRTCVVETYGDGSDDSDHILSAYRACNDGGHVVFSHGVTYTIGTAMDWTFLKHIDIGTARL